MFGDIKGQRLLLEFDDARSGSFEPLRQIPDDKTVVIGLVTSKRGELEESDVLIERIHEAARFFPLQQLALSPQCGFASSIVGNCLTSSHTIGQTSPGLRHGHQGLGKCIEPSLHPRE